MCVLQNHMFSSNKTNDKVNDKISTRRLSIVTEMLGFFI